MKVSCLVRNHCLLSVMFFSDQTSVMLTPRFSLSQDDKFLFVTIYAPFTHIDKTEVFMDENEFRFFSKPYYLRLHLPGPVVENESASASWESDTNSFNVKCPKVNEGETFTGLDMLTDLLTPKGSHEVRSKIEVISGDGGEEEDEEEEEDWYFEQKLPAKEEIKDENIEDLGYGFAFRHTGVYTNLLAELGEILDIQNPDGLSQVERDKSRTEMELRDFDSDHYLCDLYESVEEIESCLASPAPFLSCISGPADLSQPVSVTEGCPALSFSPAEQELLLGLPRVSTAVTGAVLPSVHYGLADILFGFCYTSRVLGEDSAEAAWCAAKLSSSLTSLARFRSARQVVVTSMRRSLCYPLYRHFSLARQVWMDVVTVLRVGKAAALKCLLSLISVFNSYPGHYIFNQLYINQYSSWLQTVPQSHLDSLANVLHQTIDKVTKIDLDLELQELEEAAEITVREAEEEKVTKVSQVLNRLKVEENDSDDTDSDSDSDSDASSDNENQS